MFSERFPTTGLKQTQSNTEGDGETLLCDVACQGLYVVMTATVKDHSLPPHAARWYWPVVGHVLTIYLH